MSGDGQGANDGPGVFGGGSTVYHADGSRSEVVANAFGGGSTVYHADGSRSEVVANAFGGGSTAYHADGSRSEMVPNALGGGSSVTRAPSYASSGGAGYGGAFEVIGGLHETMSTKPRTTPYFALVAAIILAPLGIALAFVALGQARRGEKSNRGVAIAAMVIGWTQVACFAALVVYMLVVFATAISST